MMDRQERSIGELFSDLGNEISALVRNEIALAKVELKQNASRVARNLVFVVAGALIGYIAMMALVATIIIALATVMAAWGAALLVTIVVGIVAAALVMKGLKALKQTDLTPRQTVQTIKEDFVWARQQVR
jgi:uncharacterized membrane protein YqjE